VLLVLLDQWSKSRVFHWLEPDAGCALTARALLGDWLSFWTSCNAGAAFGQFTQFPWVLVIGRAVGGRVPLVAARCAARTRVRGSRWSR
jgi:lipoprotein signal peptidase